MDITQILSNLQKPGDYVPPISLRSLGIMCFDAGIAPESHWPSSMRSAWFKRLRAMAWADGSAYLVRQGQAVSL